MTNAKMSIKTHLLVVALFTLLTIVYFIPFNPFYKISSYMFYGDAIQRAWAPAWFCHAVSNGLSLFDANILAPLPKSLAYSEGEFGVGVQSLLLWPFSKNAVLNFNLLNYLSFILAGYAMFLFVKEIYPDASWGALFAGIVFGFSPFRGWRAVGHLTILQLHWLPFATIFLLRSLRDPKLRNLIPFGLFTLMIFLSNLYLLVISFFFYISFVLLLFLLRQCKSSWKHLSIMAVLVIDLLIMVPFILPYSEIQDERFNILDDSIVRSANLSGYLMPPTPETKLTSISGQVLISLGFKQRPIDENLIFLGYIALGLIGVRLFFFLKKLLRRVPLENDEKIELSLFILAIIYALFSFGAYLSLNGRILPIKMPYYYLYKLVPPLQFMRAPARFGIIVIFAASFISGVSFHFILNRWKRERTRFLVFLLVAFCMFSLEYYLVRPIKTFKIADNTIFQYLREEKRLGRHYNILVLPTTPYPSRHAMLFSTFHWHSVLAGNYFPGTYLQDLKSFMDWKPSVVLLLQKYQVDCIITETLDLAERMKKVEFLQLVKEDGPNSLFKIDKEVFDKVLDTQNQMHESRFKAVTGSKRILMRKDQLEEKFGKNEDRYLPMSEKGWYRLLKSPGSVTIQVQSLNPYEYNVIEIVLRADSKTDAVSKGHLHWGTEEEQFLDDRKHVGYTVIMDGEKRVYRVDLSNNYQWLHYGNIITLRIDFLFGITNTFEIFDISIMPSGSR